MSEPFDRALRAAARRTRSGGPCPDAEQLAAYVDGALPLGERRALEAHAASCDRCLEHLALLGATSVEPARRRTPAAWLAGWRWLVPVATVMLLVVVWTRLPDEAQRPAPAAHKEAAPSTTPAPVRPERQPGQPPAPAVEPPMDARSDQPAAAASNAARARAAGSEVKATEARPAAPFLAAQSPAASTAESAAVPGDALAESVAMLDAPAAPPAAPPPGPQPAIAADRAGLVAGRLESAEAGAPSTTLMRRASGERSLSVETPWGDRYRIAGRHIERSDDGGASWHTVHADPAVLWEEVACAPDARVCWAGGMAGAVARLSGNRAERHDLPVRSAVRALAPRGDAEVLVTVEGGLRFRTTDGGRTWLRQDEER